ncbi:MAG TPA: beta-eliminating lyase-related protein [Thermoanaerobaculia bacterium]
MIDFRSDNTHAASPEIIDALARAASGTVTSYGGDPFTDRVRNRCREIFECDLEIFPVVTGTAANALALSGLTPPWGAVFCHEDAHIQRDEMGAPEFFTNGAKLIPLPGPLGKLHAAELAKVIDDFAREGRAAVPSCVSVTQATEAGTVYSVDELRAIGEVARSRNLGVHMDGARFANAVASLGVPPADLTWRAGIDVLTFGATKNGALAAEMLVVFRSGLAKEIAPRWHRAGHRLSKMRFLSAQLDAYLTEDLWLRNARHANARAREIAACGLELLRPVEANVVFARLSAAQLEALQGRVELYDWSIFGEGAHRIVAGFGTTEEDVRAFHSLIARVQ